MNVPSFHASLPRDIQNFVRTPSGLLSTIAKQQRPVAISFPQVAVVNATAFTQALQNLSIDGRVFLAHKATNSPAILSALCGVTSIDVASETELDNALRVGYAPEDIIATGPKSNHFLKRLALLPVTVIVDSHTELTRLADIIDGRTTTVLLRLSRSVLNQPGITKQSRFGLDKIQLEKSLVFLAAHKNIVLKGVAFHLDSQSIDERRYALQIALKTLLDVQQRGFYGATVLDIGGGYGTDYGISESDKSRFETAIKNMVMGKQPGITWQSRSFGIRSNGNRIIGELSEIDMPGQVTGVDRLLSTLTFGDENGTTLAQLLNENLVELWIEPGSALCADSGLFAAEIIEVRDCDGEYTVVVDAHRNQICFENNEHIADPLLIASDNARDNESCDAYIAGNLCAESDFMTYRKIHLSFMPHSGDILVWTHTGAYRSHFSASVAIGHPLSARYIPHNNSLIEDTYDS